MRLKRWLYLFIIALNIGKNVIMTFLWLDKFRMKQGLLHLSRHQGTFIENRMIWKNGTAKNRGKLHSGGKKTEMNQKDTNRIKIIISVVPLSKVLGCLKVAWWCDCCKSRCFMKETASTRRSFFVNVEVLHLLRYRFSFLSEDVIFLWGKTPR